jgi:hypothetical protein
MLVIRLMVSAAVAAVLVFGRRVRCDACLDGWLQQRNVVSASSVYSLSLSLSLVLVLLLASSVLGGKSNTRTPTN